MDRKQGAARAVGARVRFCSERMGLDRFKRAWAGLSRPRACGLVLAAGFLTAALLAGLALWLSPRPDLLEGVSFSRAVLDRHGALLRLSLSRDEKYRLRAGLADFSPLAVQAALLYEDRHFHRHPGVNPVSLARAAWRTYVSGGRRMGGSTLTMQVARLRFGLNTASPWGKLVQIVRALQIERHYSKDEILTAYLNLAPYGANVEGLAAAAWVYFRKPARELALPEALLLAAVPQNPASRNPLALTGTALTRARERMARLWAEAEVPRGGQGQTRDQHAQAIQALATAPLTVHGPATLPFLAPHACAELLVSLSGETPDASGHATANATDHAPAAAKNDPAERAASRAASHAASRTDVPATIRSTIDLPLQRLTERILSRFIQRAKSQGLDNAAALLLDHRTMDILALAGSADFNDPAISGQVDATRARRSPGSTLKPFIYALALDQGLIHPLTLLADAPRNFHGYTPENADQHFQGPLPARQALALSRNIPAIALANRLARPTFYDFLRRAGVEFSSGPEHYGLALVLGGAEVTMRELAGLYAMLPAGGIRRAPRLTLDAPRDFNATRPLLSREAAFVTLDMLKDNPLVPRTLFGDDRGSRLVVHSKTGTSNGLRDAWTAGVFGRFVLVVWVGHADGRSDPLLVGAKVAAPLFMDLAEALAAREPAPRSPERPPDGLNLVRAKVCADTGDTDTSLCPRTEATWFIPGVSPIRSTGVYREILVDRATGLRDCVFDEERTERRVFEFWPSDLARIFAQAGVRKPRPPEFRPECRERAASQGRAPDITVPRAGMRYTVSLTREEDNEVPLTAVLDADAGAVHWFADNRYLGRAEPGQTLAWRPTPGRVTVRAVDDLGRAGARVVDVELVE